VSERILSTLNASPGAVALASELIATMAPLGPATVERGIEELTSSGDIAIAHAAIADPHLGDLDLRSIAAVAEPTHDSLIDAQRRARACADRLIRTLLSTHRCG
jgi:hypothetical protein